MTSETEKGDKASGAIDRASGITLSPCHPVTLSERCRAIELLVLDVDGVLTDGGIIYADNGVELKAFHVRDGSGLKIWEAAGKQAAIVTGRTSRVVAVRAAEIGIGHVFQGAAEKQTAFRQLLQATGREPGQVCYVGDDLPDLPLLYRCGLAVAVADACPEVIAAAQYVTRAAGGRGAVREVIELILRCQGHWQRLIDRYRNAGDPEVGSASSLTPAGQTRCRAGSRTYVPPARTDEEA